MKAKILSLLKSHSTDYISGEEISRVFGISRTAVWKHVQKLRDDGYCIESHSRIGYRLLQAPDKLYQHELKDLLTGDIIGRNIVYHEVVDSTNVIARAMALKGSEEGTVIIAEEQTAGKGRMGRSWFSPAGQGLWFSIILRPQICPADAPKLTLVAAVAVAKTLREVGIQAGIKWPNDILIQGRKLAGILTEMNAEIDRVHYLVVGIGINVNLGEDVIPDELASIATSMEEYTKNGVSRIRVLASLLNNFDSLYREFTEGGFRKILDAWKEMSVTLNRHVRVHTIGSTDEGVAFDIDEEGALILMKEDGSMKRILAGEVSLRDQIYENTLHEGI
ncbi:MAG TPA: biotin--[acetyl-CoA-carboxylase] ligase [Desulfobacteria bacterium]|nr:biotin--[acetyl-CoA-carboxylase] ligase [Desulfobacteria bacterium]